MCDCGLFCLYSICKIRGKCLCINWALDMGDFHACCIQQESAPLMTGEGTKARENRVAFLCPQHSYTGCSGYIFIMEFVLWLAFEQFYLITIAT